MRQKLCILCNDSFTNMNDSKEHIIPNALGGRMKVKEFICRNCNSNSGSNWDAIFIKQLHPLCIFLNVKRENRKTPPYHATTANEQEVRVHPGGKMTLPPIFSQQQDGQTTSVQMSAPDMKIMRERIRGLIRKHPQINEGEALKNLNFRSKYMLEPIKFELDIGGKLAGRSIVKSALALIAKAGVDAHECELALQYLRHSESTPCFGLYNEGDLIVNRPMDTFLHCIHVEGDPTNYQVLGYAEYFGIYKVVMCLSNNYSGKQFTRTYSIDPATGKELELDIRLNFTESDIESIYEGEYYDLNRQNNDLERLVQKFQSDQGEKEYQRVLDDAVNYALQKCDVDKVENMTDEQADKFSQLIVERLEPYIDHLSTPMEWP